MYKTLYDEGYIDASKSLGYGASQAIQDFIDGKAAMTFDGSFNATALLAEGAGGDLREDTSRFLEQMVFTQQHALVQDTVSTANLSM